MSLAHPCILAHPTSGRPPSYTAPSRVVISFPPFLALTSHSASRTLACPASGGPHLRVSASQPEPSAPCRPVNRLPPTCLHLPGVPLPTCREPPPSHLPAPARCTVAYLPHHLGDAPSRLPTCPFSHAWTVPPAPLLPLTWARHLATRTVNPYGNILVRARGYKGRWQTQRVSDYIALALLKPKS